MSRNMRSGPRTVFACHFHRLISVSFHHPFGGMLRHAPSLLGGEMIRQVDKSRFKILVPGHPELHRELMWYATDDDTVLGVVLDLVDKDYSWVVRTENDQGPGYTAIDIGASLLSEDDATAALHDAMRSISGKS
jgi:hypothetical protein